LDFGFFDLCELPPEEWGEFLSKREHNLLLMQLNPWLYIPHVGDKVEFFQRCRDRGLPTARVRALIHPTRRSPSVAALGSTDAVRAYFDELELGDEVIVKPSGGGGGVSLQSVRSGAAGMTDMNGTPLQLGDLPDQWLADPFGFVVQDRLRQHEDLAPLMPGEALGTLRVVTAHDGQQASVMYAFVKAVVPGQQLDNFCRGSTGNILVGVDAETGVMHEGFRAVDSSAPWLLDRIRAHPDTGFGFEGAPLPHWSACRDLALRAASEFPYLRSIGWDIAATDRGPHIIEGNCGWSPDFPQLCLRRGIRTRIEGLVNSLPRRSPP